MGLEIARRLVGRGYEVAVTDVDEATTAAAAEQLGERAWGPPLDVTDSDAADPPPRRWSSDPARSTSGSTTPGILLPGSPPTGHGSTGG